MGRTIIRSTHALTYDQAKRLVAGRSADVNGPGRQSSAAARSGSDDDPAPAPGADPGTEWQDPLLQDCSASANGNVTLPPNQLDPAACTPAALAVRRAASHAYALDPPEGGTCGAPVAAADEPELTIRLRALTSVAQWLAHKRAVAGAVEFDSAELRFMLQVRRKGRVS